MVESTIETEVLVVGQGVGGLLASWMARKSGASVVCVGLGGGASGWLQGLNVALGHADPRDNTNMHAEDLLREGYGINNPDLVHQTVEAAIDGFHELVDLGVDFAHEGGKYRQRHPSGSTFARCCYVPGMMWGPKASKILRRANKSAGIHMRRLRVVRLVVVDGRVGGAIAIDDAANGQIHLVRARATILASGGVGGLFGRSTYPRDVSGSSYALALNAGARLADMEFLQFEPLVGLNPKSIRGYVIPTTLFGDGAVMRDRDGARFLLETRKSGEAGIGKEELVKQMARMQLEGRVLESGGLWLDATGVSSDTLAAYPWLTKFMTKHGIDMNRSMVDVWPAAHTCLGGIQVDLDRKSSIPGLFAVGEAAAGIHGAGRLAGGSGTDVVASAFLAGQTAGSAARDTPDQSMEKLRAAAANTVDMTRPSASSMEEARLRAIARQARKTLDSSAGILRNEADLQDAIESIDHLRSEIPKVRLPPAAGMDVVVRDRLDLSWVILMAAQKRHESRGAQLRADFPENDPELQRSIDVVQVKGAIAVSWSAKGISSQC